MSDIDDLIDRMRAGLERLEAFDERRWFHGTYLRTTEAVRDEIRRGGFADNEWVEQWDVAFASLYLDAFDTFDDGKEPSGPWRVAFGATRGPRLPPLRHVLLGMNAHVNFDLPQALLSVITDDEFGDASVRDRRSRDHEHINVVLASRVAAEGDVLAEGELPGDRGWLDRNETLARWGTRRFLKEARRKVWSNAVVLSDARRAGSLDERVAELETLSMRRVEDLIAPRNVIFELARRGFGVVVSPSG